MIIQCLGFGSIWWRRDCCDKATGEYLRKRSAIYNTTGFQVGSKDLCKWIVRGYVRLNCNSFPKNTSQRDLAGKLFYSDGINYYSETNRLLLNRFILHEQQPDYILFAFKSKIHGAINFRGKWRSKNVKLISFSGRNGVQELLLMMPIGGRIATTLGIWEVVCQQSAKNSSCKIVLSSNLR